MGVGALLCAALPVYSLAAVGPFLVAEEGYSSTAIGSLTTVVYIVAIVLSPIAGHRIDGLEIRDGLATLFALSAVALLLMAVFGGSYLGLVVAIALTGVALSIANPVTNRLIQSYAPKERRGTFTGLKQSGGQIAPAVAGGVLPLAAGTFGWRVGVGAFALFGIGGLMMARSLPRRGRVTTTSVGERSDRAERRPVRLMIYAAAMGFVASAVFTHVPIFASSELEVPPVRAGALIGLLGVVGTVGRISWGLLGDGRLSVKRILQLLAILSFASAGSLIISVTMGPGWLVAGVVLNALSSQSWTVIAMLAIVRLSGSRTGARSGQVVAGGLVGGMLGPLTIGVLADRQGTYVTGWMVCATLSLASLLVATWKVAPAAPRP